MPSRLSLATFASVLVLTTVFASACSEPQGQPVTYRNEMSIELTVTSDDFFLVTLLPRQSKSQTTREGLLPDRIRAYSPQGDVVFDKTFTWEDLKASNFLVVIK
jgi:hypothetical protein